MSEVWRDLRAQAQQESARLRHAAHIRESRATRYPLERVEEMWRRQHPDRTLDDVCELLAITKTTWLRWKASGVTWATADHIASKLEYGPDDLWPDMWWPDDLWVLPDDELPEMRPIATGQLEWQRDLIVR